MADIAAPTEHEPLRPLVVGFAVMTLVAVLLGALALTVMQLTLRRHQALVAQHLGDLVLTEQLDTASNAAARKARDYLLTGDAAHLDQLAAARAQFTALLDRVAAGPLMPEKRARVDAVRARWGAAGAAANRALEARRRTGKVRGETERIAAEQMLPERARFDAALEALRRHERALYDEAQARADAVAARAWRLLAVAFLCAVAVAGALAVLVRRTMRQRERTEAARRALEAQRAETLEQLQRTAEFRERFVGILGHDLRGPLGAITLSSQSLLTANGLPERERRAVVRIFASAGRMARMIDELLDFTRARLGGGLPVQRAPVDLGALCRELVDELEASDPQAHVAQEVHGDARGAWDAGRLGQLVQNLVGNALQHAPVGTPVRVLVDGRAPDAVVLEVHNGGDPIPPELLPRLFEPFLRASRADAARPAEGLGLGLYIAQQIALAHGGALAVRSTAEAGTTFTARLPRAASAPHPAG